MAWTVKKDFYGSELHGYFVHRDVPVIIHRTGSYPCLVNDEGVSSFYHPHVTVAVSKDYDEMIVTALSGTNIRGVRPRSLIARLPFVDGVDAQIEAVRPHLDEAAYRATQVHAEYEKALGKIWEIPEKDLTREEYEALCAKYGVKVYADEDLASGGAGGHFSYPEYPVETCIEARLAQWRGAPLKAERQAAQEAAQAARIEATRIERVEKLARLKAFPVTGTETRRIPATKALSVGLSFVDQRGRLLTVIDSVYRGRITEDDPSVHGEHLHGCEGQKSYDVTYEIRQKPAECPAP